MPSALAHARLLYVRKAFCKSVNASASMQACAMTWDMGLFLTSLRTSCYLAYCQPAALGKQCS